MLRYRCYACGISLGIVLLQAPVTHREYPSRMKPCHFYLSDFLEVLQSGHKARAADIWATCMFAGCLARLTIRVRVQRSNRSVEKVSPPFLSRLYHSGASLCWAQYRETHHCSKLPRLGPNSVQHADIGGPRFCAWSHTRFSRSDPLRNSASNICCDFFFTFGGPSVPI